MCTSYTYELNAETLSHDPGPRKFIHATEPLKIPGGKATHNSAFPS